MNYQIRQIIAAHGRMPVDPHALEDHADLYQAGMTSHASVNAMLALEDAFNIECPDAMLTRGVFESIAAALTELDAMTNEQGGLGPVAKFRAAVGGRRDVPRPSSQRAQELTFDVSIAVASPKPTAVASSSYHRDHFGQTFGIELADGRSRTR
ncbi:MAG: hypothetical protein QOJ29_1048 [Thermoleophilaceae bacterium]|nr:hypothetical protein [Thermoleophilaceae bacterium]